MLNPVGDLPLTRNATDAFRYRHLGTTPVQQEEMAQSAGFESVQELIETTVPNNIKLQTALSLPPALSESEALTKLRRYADQNKVLRSCIGMGYYDTITPPVLLRNVFENPGWYTAYTPYQPEISQGRLETLLTFQQVIIDLTGMPLANASLLDEATAAAEAMTLMQRMNRKSKSKRFVVASDCHPQTISLVETRAEPLGITVEIVEPDELANVTDAFGVLAQYPGTYGDVRDLSDIIDHCHNAGALVGVASDLLALTLLKSPGAMGADVVFGNSQRFGVPLGYGGPHAAFFATRDEFKRSMPGRVIGVSVDSKGRQALRMAMQTREQHIRREKATSNICTAQALLAIMAGLFAMHHGPQGLRGIGQRVHQMTSSLAASLTSAGFNLQNASWFDTLCVEVDDAAQVIQAAELAGFNFREISSACIGVSLDETTTDEELRAIYRIFDAEPTSGRSGIPSNLLREMDYLSHPLFSDYRTETEMLRYLKRLENKDISLTRAMIPLGSCTMKLNAAAEMIPVSWPEFSRIHPFAPQHQVAGYRAMLNELTAWLTECTGYDAMSLQPNSGAQGEYAGLMAIRRYHRARGEAHRNICLIPTSAHGTNPASAVMAGMTVVPLQCDERGDLDVADLETKIAKHGDHLAALMVTYPSTHGVFEATIREVCDMVHAAGGQVYLDGANMNAMVGLAKPGDLGADVCHLNLHKTFCIPHGGGGPGMGPIGLAAHLLPYRPGHPVQMPDGADSSAIAPISGAPYGSASILAISWMYLEMMGPKGLREATELAILNANYMAARLSDHFSILYTSPAGRCAHEFILDCRAFEKTAGIRVEDIAKRLMDYGFHAPTMSWPVPGTLMIEPTESEDRAELDRYCDALIAIREEIREIESGEADRDVNLLKMAPHTQSMLVTESWDRPYAKERAVYPLAYLRESKFWPPVARVDNPWGDRNIFCSCAGVEEVANLVESAEA